jgi:uncharacterized membrane protein YbhN (UPF0104 family)
MFLLNIHGTFVKQLISTLVFYILNFCTLYIHHVAIHVKIWYIYLFVVSN